MNKDESEELLSMLHKRISIELNGIKTNALLQTYFLDASEELYQSDKRPVILVMPGGAYRLTSDREAEPIALRLNAMGYHAAVLRYNTEVKFPQALLEVAQAFCLLKDHAQEWNIDEKRIITMGFSAGGHLCASYGIYWNHEMLQSQYNRNDLRPFAQILCYPVITSGEFSNKESMHNLLQDSYDNSELCEMLSLEKQVHEDVPRTFLWHTYTDPTVSAENSLLFAMALKKHNVLCEFHMYDKGEHGLSTAMKISQRNDGKKLQKECAGWMELLETWLNSL